MRNAQAFGISPDSVVGFGNNRFIGYANRRLLRAYHGLRYCTLDHPEPSRTLPHRHAPFGTVFQNPSPSYTILHRHAASFTILLPPAPFRTLSHFPVAHTATLAYAPAPSRTSCSLAHPTVPCQFTTDVHTIRSGWRCRRDWSYWTNRSYCPSRFKAGWASGPIK